MPTARYSWRRFARIHSVDSRAMRSVSVSLWDARTLGCSEGEGESGMRDSDTRRRGVPARRFSSKLADRNARHSMAKAVSPDI